jgi:Glycosyltransferase family 87
VIRRLRDHGPALVVAAAGVWMMSYLALYGFGWNDYASEVVPAYDALLRGHLSQFLALAPGYGGSLELRAPFAFLPGLWHGGEVAVYQAVSIPCLVAAALFAVWLVGRMRAFGVGRLARATALGLCVVNPVTLYALQDGHPEELLGAVLCVAAVLAALRGRAGWAGVLLGLAIVNKQWALLAIGPVLVALPAQRWRTMAVAGTIAVGFYLPLLLPAYITHSGGSSTAAVVQSSSGTVFQPWQLWWFFGTHGHAVQDTFGIVKVGYRAPPAWIGIISHPLIVALSVPATLLALRRGRRDALLLLAFLLAIRFMFDTWDTVYYPLPFIFALLAWETLQRREPPVLSLVASVVVWLVYIVAPEHLTADAQAALFLLVALPTLIALGVALFGPGLRLHRGARTPSTLSRAPAVPS